MPTVRTTPDICAKQLVETIPMVMRFIRAEVKRKNSLPVTLPQVRIMGFIERNPNCSLGNVTEFLQVTTGTCSAAVDRLVSRGLVNRVKDQSERRRINLSLTEEGNRLLTMVGERAQAAVKNAISSLPAAELQELETSLGLLKKVFVNVRAQAPL
jgi:DNA-binding MarR family transcriptional regulator